MNFSDLSRYARKTTKKVLPSKTLSLPLPPLSSLLGYGRRFGQFGPLRTKTEAGALARVPGQMQAKLKHEVLSAVGGGLTPTAPSPDPRLPRSGPHLTLVPVAVGTTDDDVLQRLAEQQLKLLWRKDSLKIGSRGKKRRGRVFLGVFLRFFYIARIVLWCYVPCCNHSC